MKNITVRILKLKYFNKNYLSWLNNKENQKFTQIKKKNSLIEIKNYYKINKKERNKLFGIFYKTKHIGNINVKYLSNKSCYIGYLLGDKKFRSKGITSYAVNLVIKKCFNFYKFKRVYSNTDKKNLPSIKLLLNNNFKKLDIIPTILVDKQNNNNDDRKLIYFNLLNKNFKDISIKNYL